MFSLIRLKENKNIFAICLFQEKLSLQIVKFYKNLKFSPKFKDFYQNSRTFRCLKFSNKIQGHFTKFKDISRISRTGVNPDLLEYYANIYLPTSRSWVYESIFLLYIEKKNNSWYLFPSLALIPHLLYLIFFAYKLLNNMCFLDHVYIVVYIL